MERKRTGWGNKLGECKKIGGWPYNNIVPRKMGTKVRNDRKYIKQGKLLNLSLGLEIVVTDNYIRKWGLIISVIAYT